ncbi:coilin-like isoform X1 [Cucumis sativus]|uniref:coilin-like isoform X1 n=1 Tax=Cucumis sativus TaxID=3659 RepID=UPI0012F4BB2C|nr:coilin-like isoform X1 [Cucumis sativus]XP_031736547.1 coilin-like isoform X1 [Cucumis sativus]
MDDDTVPVVVKPGHIRFEPVGKVVTDQAGQEKQNHFLKETLHWNGITNKKKGQKWGKEKSPSWKRNNSNDCSSEPLQLLSETEQPKTPVPVVGSIHFDELPPYTGLPQVWFAQIASICFLKCLVGHARFAKWNNQVTLAVLIKLHFSFPKSQLILYGPIS